jgi:hypothetical protein
MQLGHYAGLPALDPSEVIIASLLQSVSKKKRDRRRKAQ